MRPKRLAANECFVELGRIEINQCKDNNAAFRTEKANIMRASLFGRDVTSIKQKNTLSKLVFSLFMESLTT